MQILKTAKKKKKTASDNVLRDKAFNIVKNPKYDGYQRTCLYGLQCF